MNLDAIPDEYRGVIEDLEAAYWVPILHTPFEALGEIESASAQDCPQLHQPFIAFVSNLRAAKDLLEFPYFLLLPFLPDVKASAAKIKGASDKLESELTEEEKIRMIDLVTVTMRATQGHLLDKRQHLQRLLHQAAILVWGALETYSKQVFIATLNQRPSLYKAIARSPALKERFSISNGFVA